MNKNYFMHFSPVYNIYVKPTALILYSMWSVITLYCGIDKIVNMNFFDSN